MDSYSEYHGGTATTEHDEEQEGRWASRRLRRAAHQMDDDQTGRDLLLRAADRINSLEEQIPHLLSREGLEDLERQVRRHPYAMMALAVGAGYLLERTRLVQGIVGAGLGGGGALAGALFSGGSSLGERGNGRLTEDEEQLLAWLNDAYAMEMAQLPILENHASDARRHPEVRKRDLQHLKETRQHAKDVRRCIEYFGEKPSVTKKMIGKVTGAMQSVSTEPFQDEIMKNFLMDYASEHFEIASYRSLIVAAEEAGHPKIARICQQILEEEEAMAEWLEDHLPKAVRITMHE
jgi:ferritin-like metal-binding protein YciE